MGYEKIMKGKRCVAMVFDVPSGKTLLLSRSLSKMHRETVRGRRLGINEAIEMGKAAWGVDEHWASYVRRHAVQWLAIQVKSQRLLYVVDAAALSDPNRYYSRPRNKQGDFWRCIPISEFTVKNR